MTSSHASVSAYRREDALSVLRIHAKTAFGTASAAPNFIRVRKLLYDFTVRYTTTKIMYEAPKVREMLEQVLQCGEVIESLLASCVLSAVWGLPGLTEFDPVALGFRWNYLYSPRVRRRIFTATATRLPPRSTAKITTGTARGR